MEMQRISSLWIFLLLVPYTIARPRFNPIPSSYFQSSPLLSNGLNNSLILPRGASQDPSCPDGFLCIQESCPDGVECAEGEICVNFEGSYACAPSDLHLCALNPDTFEGVSCESGICCHGNCYSSDAVCCDFPSFQCTVGTLCNACNPGQTCGDNICVNGSPISSTTTHSSISSHSTITAPPTTSSSDRSTSLSSLPTSTSSSSTSTSSVTIPTPPVVVQSDGSFEHIGCFVDTVASRVLQNGSSQDTTGMTVEECINLGEGWQYAGVEFGSQCFWGDELIGSSSAPLSDCSTPCAGNASEICGNGNRIDVYQDVLWFIPTTQYLMQLVGALNDTVYQLHEELLTYQDDLNEILRDGTSTMRARTPQGGTATFDPQSVPAAIIAKAVADEERIMALVALIKSIFKTQSKYFGVGEFHFVIDVETKAESQNLETFLTVAEAVANTPTIDWTASGPVVEELINNILSIAKDALASIGLTTDVVASGAVAKTLFGALGALIGSLLSSSSTGQETPPPTQTPTQTTSISSSSTTPCYSLLRIFGGTGGPGGQGGVGGQSVTGTPGGTGVPSETGGNGVQETPPPIQITPSLSNLDTIAKCDVLLAVYGGVGGQGGLGLPGGIGGDGGDGEGPAIRLTDDDLTHLQIVLVSGGSGGSGAEGNPPGLGGVGEDATGDLQYALTVEPGINGANGMLNKSLGQGGNGGIGGGPLIEVITLEAAIQARSNLTIPLQPGPFKTGNGGKGGSPGKSIGQWKGGKGGNGGKGGQAYVIWDTITQSWLGVSGEDGEDGGDGEDAQIRKHGADGVHGKDGKGWGNRS